MIRLLIACSAACLIAAMVFSGSLAQKQVESSPYYMYDGDIHYFAPGPEFKLSREAAAQKARQGEEPARREATRSY